jgi:hypothetical protein
MRVHARVRSALFRVFDKDLGTNIDEYRAEP